MVKCKPSIICLENGMQLIVGIISEDETNIETTIPLEITRIKISDTHEALSLRPWISFTDQESYMIKQSKIITVCSLDEQYTEGFYKMTEGYMEDRKEGLDFMDAMDDYDPQIDEDATLDEIMDKITRMGKPKDQLH
jgi:hypothetical protein